MIENSRKTNWVGKSDSNRYDNYLIYRKNKNDPNQIQNTVLAELTLEWIHKYFGRYIKMNYNIPKERTHFLYKFEMFNILTRRYHQENKEAQEWVFDAYKLDLGNIDYFKFFDHYFVLEKCIITNPYINDNDLYNIRSNKDFYIMKLNENLYNTTCHSFIIFLKEDYPSFASEIPCGWSFM